ncbi:MAG: TetR/AcrR family transcriptional regulator [Candidatus Izemoplasmatales bacterium]
MPTNTFINLDKDKKDKIIEAALNQFSEKQYEQVNISDIIKTAKIPRGSFYQYFNDKEDLYLHLISGIRDKKMQFLEEDINNSENLRFIDLIKKLYMDGVRFAIKYPKYVKMMDFLLKNRNQIYDKIMKDNLLIAENLYASLIEKDKAKGYIKKDIDTRTFAKIVVQLTSNIAIEELNLENEEESYQKMLEQNEKVLKIIEYGVLERTI